MNKDDLIYVAGHRGLLGSAVVRKLESLGYKNLLLKTSLELDLRDQYQTFSFLKKGKPNYIFLCAARVGGIQANIDSPGSFLYENLQIQNNIFEGARIAGVKKLLFVGSSCVYPREAPCPIKEELLMTGQLEPTNEGYALAKIAGIKLCQFYRKQYGMNYISAQPTNLFGPNDQYDLQKSHLLPALILKIHLAKIKGEKTIELWGSGKPRREFMLSDDCADALVFLMNHYSSDIPINIGTGEDKTVMEIANIVSKVLEADVKFTFDASKPDGMMRKLLDSSKLNNLGWRSGIPLEEGVRIAYGEFLKGAAQV